MALTKVSYSMISDSPINPKDFGAVGDGVADDSSAIQAALDTALTTSGAVLLPQGTYRVASQLRIPTGVTLFGITHPSGTFINQNESITDTVTASIYVDFGQGTPNPTDSASYTVYYNAAAVVMANSSKISNIAFWYPNQVKTGSPYTYGPAITAEYSVTNVSIENINLGNSYVGIDISRNNVGTNISHICGTPLYKGIVCDCCVDPPSVNNVDFNGFYIYGTGAWPANNLTFWIADNGIALQVGRVTWATFQDFFAYGYRYGVQFIQSTVDVTNGRVQAGLASNCNFENFGFDSCQSGFDSGIGNYKITISNSNIVARHPKDPTNPAKQSAAIRMSRPFPNTVLDASITVQNVRFWNCTQDVIYIKNYTNPRVIGCNADEVGSVTAAYFCMFDSCFGGEISGCYAAITAVKPGNGAINLRDCTSSKVINCTIKCEGSPYAGTAVEVQLASEYCQVAGNYSDMTGNVFVLTNGYYTNLVQDNSIENDIYTEADVVSNVLQLRPNARVIRLQPSTPITIDGITNWTKGSSLIIRCSTNAVTFTDDSGSVNVEDKMSLAGNFVTTFGDVLMLASLGSTGWYEVSRSAN